MAARKARSLSKKQGTKKGGAGSAHVKSGRPAANERDARQAKASKGGKPKAKPVAKVAPAKPKVKAKPEAATKKSAPSRAQPAAPPAREAKPGKGAAEKVHKAPPPKPPKADKAKPASAAPPAKASPPAKGASPAKSASSGKRLSAPPRPAVREPQQRVVALPLPLAPPPRRLSLEERAASVETRVTAATEEFRHRYTDSFDMSWIYHDSALEGVVYFPEELRASLSGQAQPVTDSGLQPTYDDIRRHKEAIEFVRDFATKKRLPVTVDVIKKIYLILHPEEADIKNVKYRKDIPQHRLYFHEYAPPDKVAYKVRQVVDWLNDPETRKTRNAIRIAARAHYDLLRVYPFPTDSGKVARLFMNLLLLRAGLPPSIIHSTERQRYYDALKGSATIVLQMVQESVENALASVEKLLDEHESRTRAFVS